MFKYDVFGGVLASSIPFPELASAPSVASPTWTVSRVETLDDTAVGLSFIGEDSTCAGLRLRLYRSMDRWRLDYDVLGSYDVSIDGSRITWYPGAHDCEDCARQCILGRVLALAIKVSGDLCLHASCVELGGRGIALIAPKGTGKSTLAAALVAGGAPLVTDDMLRVAPFRDARICSGVQRLRLCADSAVIASGVGIPSRAVSDGKHVTGPLTQHASLPVNLRLGAFYLLRPVSSAVAGSASRQLLPGSQAVMALMSNVMLGPLLGEESREVLESVAQLASFVPVYMLDVPRGYEFLPDIATSLRTWHSGAAVVAESAAGSERRPTQGVSRVA